MNFRVVKHVDAVVVEDDIFQYLVVDYSGENGGTVDVFRTVRGGCYEFHRAFFDFAHFEQRMPETAKAILSEREENANRREV
jgi:hypothetical protein